MKKILLLSAVAALLAGCSSTDTVVFEEDVQINSMPEGANVFLNGEVIGQTPMSVSLNKDSVYEIRLSKQGYKDDVVSLASKRTDPFIKFGPLVDMGYYKELVPAPVDAQLKPDFLPAYPGVNAFGDMVSNIEKADAMRKSGEITPEEHSYLIGQIMNFYTTAK